MLSMDLPVAELVLDHSECALVFDRHRIDYCCRGTRSLRAACEERGVDPARVLDECELAVRRRGTTDVDPRSLSTHELITQVIGAHHRYLHRTLPFLQALSQKVARVHGDRQPSLRELARGVDTLATVLVAHLADEERNLFPALLSQQQVGAATRLMLGNMRSEHEQVGTMLSVMREIASDYEPPEWACNSYRTLLAELAHLEADTLRHVHLENHVLLPRFMPSA